MADDLRLRRLDTAHVAYATIYEHPELGAIEVGRLNYRSGQPHSADAWHWSIGIVARPALGGEAQGTAATQKAAREAWKRAWPKFRDARTDAEWHDIKAAQEHSAKLLMIADARKRPGLSADQLVELRAEAARPGPAPHWLRALLDE